MNPADHVSADRVLIVEDDPGLRQLLAEEVGEHTLDVRTTHSAEEAQPLLANWEPSLIVSDLRLPGAGALELLQATKSLPVPPAFIVITAFGTIPEAVQALKSGADDFLTKPLDLEHFILTVSRVLETRRLKQEVRRFRSLLGGERFHGMLGRSQAMQVLFDLITQVAQARGPVLIVGESGVGKELVAHAIHREGPRAPQPFLAINCMALPEHLMESELFGHVAGAFTGASQTRKGLLLEANGGTLLLDEIAEMPPPLQGKLLRVLEDGDIRAVGSNRTDHVDVRIVAATNRDLKTEVEDGRFREDLYYRLETFLLRIPPLRERGEDIELLSGHFLNQMSLQMGKTIHGISAEAVESLKQYSFPGNVRELRNAMERAVTFCQDETISIEHLPPRFRQPMSISESSSSHTFGAPESLLREEPLVSLAEIEQRYIRHVLAKLHGNKRRAAEVLGIGRRTLYRRLGEEGDGGDEGTSAQ